MYNVLSQMDNSLEHILKQGAKVAKSFRFYKTFATFAHKSYKILTL
jgi:hypothetical protein